MIWVTFLVPDAANELSYLTIIPQKGSTVRLAAGEYKVVNVCHNIGAFGKHSAEIELEKVED